MSQTALELLSSPTAGQQNGVKWSQLVQFTYVATINANDQWASQRESKVPKWELGSGIFQMNLNIFLENSYDNGT